jgi:fructokinase
MRALLGGVETGGTKVVCAVGTGPGDLRERVEFPTTGPEETLGRAVEFFRARPIAALGVASFGPVDVHERSPTWGHVTATPKAGWSHTPVAPVLRAALGVPVGFDTDVGAAALGEHLWGAGRGCPLLVYVTVGTGIGSGIVAGGRPLRGLVHSEIGHVRVPHDRERDPFGGICPFHGDCLEGLASGPALAARWGRPASELAPDHAAWPLEAEYLALMCLDLACVISPHRIVLGGGVMHAPGLLDRVRRGLDDLLAGYVAAPDLAAPGLGGDAGVLGAIALAQQALDRGEPGRGAADR